MEAKTADVSRGVAWFTGGWRILMKNPGVWIVQGVIFIAIVFVLALVPFLGQLLISLFMPVLTAGLLYAAREADAGRRLEFLQVFQGFREQSKLTPLLALGGVALAGFILSIVVALLIGGPGTVSALLSGNPDMVRGVAAGVLVALLAALVVQLLVAMALAYAVPLVMFGDTPASQTLGSSFRACLRNVLPLTVFGVIYLFVALLASLPLFLGWIVLLPASAGMYYLSYKDLYEAV
jgi:uncharacterized membrane protein